MQCDPELNPFTIKDIIGTVVETRMWSEDQMVVIFSVAFLMLIVILWYANVLVLEMCVQSIPV